MRSARPTSSEAVPPPAPHACDGFPTPGHDHRACVADTLARAEAAFRMQGLRLTPLRQQVLAEIANSHEAVGAYSLLRRLAEGAGRKLAPISVYRALDSLVAAGVVHRLESRNAFFACHAAHAGDRGQIVLACDRCGMVVEVPGGDTFASIEAAADATGFKPSRSLVEVQGACRRCRSETA